MIVTSKDDISGIIIKICDIKKKFFWQLLLDTFCRFVIFFINGKHWMVLFRLTAPQIKLMEIEKYLIEYKMPNFIAVIYFFFFFSWSWIVNGPIITSSFY